jgi:hypothetical protein
MKEIDAMLHDVTEDEVRETMEILNKTATPRPPARNQEARA